MTLPSQARERRPPKTHRDIARAYVPLSMLISISTVVQVALVAFREMFEDAAAGP